MAVVKYFADSMGNYVGAFEGVEPPAGSIEVTAPNHGLDHWDGDGWIPYVAVPSEITMRQARLVLLGAGKLAAVETAINAMSEPTKSAAQIEWEYSNTVQRHNGFVSQLGPALGLTDAEIDAMFIAGAAL